MARKLTLRQQEEFVRGIIARCELYGGETAHTTSLLLTDEDVEALRVVADTLGVFGFYRADTYVRDRATRQKRR